MAKPLTSWLVPSFLQHNLRLVVSEFRDVVCVFQWRGFQDKFASLRQVNNPNSWEKFQICCTDMYLIRFLPNFAVFCMFLWICDSATTWKLRSPDYELHHLHHTNWRLKICIWWIYFFSWSPEGDHISSVSHQKAISRVFFNFEPCLSSKKVHPHFYLLSKAK